MRRRLMARFRDGAAVVTGLGAAVVMGLGAAVVVVTGLGVVVVVTGLVVVVVVVGCGWWGPYSAWFAAALDDGCDGETDEEEGKSGGHGFRGETGLLKWGCRSDSEARAVGYVASPPPPTGGHYG